MSMFAIDYHKKSEEIVQFIRSTVHTSGFENVIVALSGGVDSSVSCALAVQALSASHVFAVMLPYETLNTEGIADARLVIETLKVPQGNIQSIDIKKSVDTLLENCTDVDEIRRGNIMARVRMIYLFDLAKKHKALVVGTENKTEHLLGYYTRFGDEASDIEPIRNLYKTQVWEMAKYLRLPEKIITKAPTAGLWQDQTDETEFGFSYHKADIILFAHTEEKLSAEAITAKYHLSPDIVQKVLAWARKNAFKHHLPKVCK